MTKHNGDATWVEIDPTTLDQTTRDLYDGYKAAYRLMKEARVSFESHIGQVVPDGKRMIFGYNFGKLSVAIVDDDRKPVKPKATKQSLADYLAGMSASGHQH